MNLYFRDSYGRKRLIASNLQLEKEIWGHIKKFLDDHNFKSYYTRMWYKNGYTWYDVGSHAEFFLVDANMMEQYEDEQEEEKALYNTTQRDKRAFGYRPE
jgi:tRNA G10  N-methylase Trm11